MFFFQYIATYGSYVGLAITQTISLVGLFQWTIKQFAGLENQMNSVERIFEYINSPPEANFLSSPGYTI